MDFQEFYAKLNGTRASSSNQPYYPRFHSPYFDWPFIGKCEPVTYFELFSYILWSVSLLRYAIFILIINTSYGPDECMCRVRDGNSFMGDPKEKLISKNGNRLVYMCVICRRRSKRNEREGSWYQSIFYVYFRIHDPSLPMRCMSPFVCLYIMLWEHIIK